MPEVISADWVTGETDAVKEEGAVLTQALREIKVLCLDVHVKGSFW